MIRLQLKMLLLKLAYAIEIGAYHAYIGHYKASGDKEIRRIAREELRHMAILNKILKSYGVFFKDHVPKPSKILNAIFFIIGTTIKAACSFFPLWLMNRVAGTLEILNVINYKHMSRLFPGWEITFLVMQSNEQEHEIYFKSLYNPPKIPSL